jgi:hypothetical protein
MVLLVLIFILLVLLVLLVLLLPPLIVPQFERQVTLGFQQLLGLLTPSAARNRFSVMNYLSSLLACVPEIGKERNKEAEDEEEENTKRTRRVRGTGPRDKKEAVVAQASSRVYQRLGSRGTRRLKMRRRRRRTQRGRGG